MWLPSTPTTLKILPVVLYATLFGVVMCQKMGPFSVVIRNFENCGPTSGRGFVFDPHIRKYNRSLFVVDTNLTMTVDMDDSLDVAVDMSLFTNGGWKPNYFKQVFKRGCSTVKFYGNDVLATILKKAGLKPQCPFPKGNYSITQLPSTMEVPGVPAFFYNKYKWKGRIIEGGNNVLGCMQMIVDVVPKKNH